MAQLDIDQFERILCKVCDLLTEKVQKFGVVTTSKNFEDEVRVVVKESLVEFGIEVDFAPHPFGFPDVVLGEFGIEVKFTQNDTWRSVANSVFERFKNRDVKYIYVIFGKMGGDPSVRWAKYEDCVMHVRTSHVPRFELDIDAETSLFQRFGITYADFTMLSEEHRMDYIRDYARSRLKKGERLWWLQNLNEGSHALQLQVQLFSNLTKEEKLTARAEASLLCPRIVGSSRDRTKYVDPILYLLTYKGILASRDAFSAGSVAGPDRGGIYVQRALISIEKQMREAALRLEDALFVEYWGYNVVPSLRIAEWLKLADKHASGANPAWKPSEVLFKKLS